MTAWQYRNVTVIIIMFHVLLWLVSD